MIWVAIMGIVLIGIVGLSLDWGKVALNVNQLQNAADAAALAGAQYVKFDHAEAIAKAIALGAGNKADNVSVTLRPNPSYDATLDVVVGNWYAQSRAFIPAVDASSGANAVKVVARRNTTVVDGPLPLIFGSIFGTSSANVTCEAIAWSIGSTGAGLITLSEYPTTGPRAPTGLYLGGGSIVTVNGGDIHVNSNSTNSPKEALVAAGSFTLDCEELEVNGDISPAFDDPFWDTVGYSINPNSGVVLPDPLKHVQALWSSLTKAPVPAADPGYMPLPAYGKAVKVDPTTGSPLPGPEYMPYDFSSPAPINGTVIQDPNAGVVVNGVPTLTLTPGYYPGGIQLTTGNKIKLLPGVYAFGGGNGKGGASGLNVNGGALEGLGVMLYVTASNILSGKGTPIWGNIDLAGGTVTIREAYDPTDPDAEPYSGYAGSDYKYIALYQDRKNPQVVEINGNTQLDLSGTLYFPTAHVELSGTGIDAGTQFIAGSLATAGNTSVTINYDGRFFTAGYQSLLVK